MKSCKSALAKYIVSILLLSMFITNSVLNVASSPSDVFECFDSPGEDPFGLTWDGNYLWHSDKAEDTIYKLDPTDASIIDSFETPGNGPTGLTWDGNYLWCTDLPNAKIYKINHLNGDVISSFDSPNIYPQGLAWDGNYLWHADDEIFKLDHTSGDVVDSIISPGNAPIGVAWDGNYLWNSDRLTDKIYQLNPIDGSINKIYNSPGDEPRGIVIIEDFIWIADSKEDKIYKIKISDLNSPPNNPTTSYDKENNELILSAVDPDEDQIRFGISWNEDYIVDQWTEFVESGDIHRVDCDTDKKTVNIIAEDELGAQSSWVSQKSRDRIFLNVYEWFKCFSNWPFTNFPLLKLICSNM